MNNKKPCKKLGKSSHIASVLLELTVEDRVSILSKTNITKYQPRGRALKIWNDSVCDIPIPPIM
jgi:hypothetical protein